MIHTLRFKLSGVFLWLCLKAMPRSRTREMFVEAVEGFIADAGEEFGVHIELKDSLK